MMKRMPASLLILVALSLSAGPALARVGEFKLKDGGTYFGEISEVEGGYRVISSGVALTVKTEQIEGDITYYKDLDDAYAQKKAGIKSDDANGHYQLASWAKDQEYWKGMKEQADAALAANENHLGAKMLLDLYEKVKDAGPTTVKPPSDGDDDKNGNDKPPDKMPRLSKEDINRIRLLEMHQGEKLAIRFASGFLDKFLEQMKGDPDLSSEENRRKFLALSSYPDRQLKIILSKTPAELHWALASHVEIRQDPNALKAWNSKIHHWVLNNCAAANCHGGPNDQVPYRLILVNRRDITNSYTNFFVTSEYRTSRRAPAPLPGPRPADEIPPPDDAGPVKPPPPADPYAPAPFPLPLIDRDRSQDSLLLQYSLPTNLSRQGMRHPLVNGRPIRVLLKSEKDSSYRLIEQWISGWNRGGLKRFKPVYHITWPPKKEEDKPKPRRAPTPAPAKG